MSCIIPEVHIDGARPVEARIPKACTPKQCNKSRDICNTFAARQWEHPKTENKNKALPNFTI